MELLIGLIMNKNPTSKVCLVCNKIFTPDPRVGGRQKVCKELYCQQERKKLAQKAWLLKNPDYFKGRYPELKETILQNQKDRRSRQKEQVLLIRSDIQDELSTYKNSKLLQILNNAMAIQDELTSRITMAKKYLMNSLTLIYKTS